MLPTFRLNPTYGIFAMSEIVKRSDGAIKTTCFEVSKFDRPTPGSKLQFEVNVVAQSDGKMRKHAIVEPNMPSWGTFEMYADEGQAIGGDDTAPPPLGYLSAGIAFCLLSHMTMYAQKKELKIESLRVEQKMRFSTRPNHGDSGPPASDGGCDGLETHVVIESDEPNEVIQAFIENCTSTCMALQAIVNATPQSTVVHLNGNRLT